MWRTATIALVVSACSFTPRGDGDAAGDGDPIDAAVDAPIDAPRCGPAYEAGLGYRLHATASTWLEAEQACEADGGYLAVLDTPTSITAAIAAARALGGASELWVGLVRDPISGGEQDVPANWRWRWVNGAEVRLPLAWNPGQPDNAGEGTQYVVRMARDTGALYDRDIIDSGLTGLCQCDGRAPVNADYDPETP